MAKKDRVAAIAASLCPERSFRFGEIAECCHQVSGIIQCFSVCYEG